MAHHESDGAVPHWESRTLFCLNCEREYVQQSWESAICPYCSKVTVFDVRAITYKGDKAPTEPTLIDTNEGGEK
jgi:DNA-directed RNA polymerase subunit RPC12/RpoP